MSWKPYEITPQSVACSASAAGLVEYLRAEAALGPLLTERQALVFRGFKVAPQALENVIDLLLPHRLAYVHGNSPRTKVGNNVYTSTEYPPEYTISMHNEMSYAASWPARLMFFCEQAPRTGGATPIVDGGAWLRSLDDEVRDAFAAGVRYTQNLHDGLGLGKSWQDTFESTDRDRVEELLTASGADWEWRRDGGLRVHMVRPATLEHPVSGNEVWFNQSDQWHPAALGDDTAAALARIMPEQDLPQSVTFADGSPIPGEYVIQIRDRGLATAVDVPWYTGDLMLIDNIAVGHGRRSFTGARRVLVAMSD